jgi:hypothetical protein
MNMECSEQIDIYGEYDLQTGSTELLKHLLDTLNSCHDCAGCDGMKRVLEEKIAKRETEAR